MSDNNVVNETWSSGPSTLPLDFIASGPDATGHFRTNDTVWWDYRTPLLNRAYGYAQSALALLFPPVYAEIVPDVAHPLTDVKVRIRNLGPTPGAVDASPNDGVTWHLSKVQVKPIQPVNAISAATPNAGDSFPVTDASGVSVAPGLDSTWESAPFTLSTDQQFGLAWASHTAVEVEAQLGTGSSTTQLQFGLPIPGALVVISQTGTTNKTTSPATANTVSCTPAACDTRCTTCGMSGKSVNANIQEVTGTITLYPTQLDAMGRPATSGDTQTAMKQGAHLAAVAIVDIPGDGNMQNAVIPSSPNNALTLTSSGGSDAALQQPDPSVPFFYVRSKVVDEGTEPTGWKFDATIDVGALITQLKAVSNQEAVVASDTLYLAAWTTSGQLWVQKLALWSVPTPMTTAQQVTNPCAPTLDGTLLAIDSCSSNDTFDSTQNTCDPNGTSTYAQASSSTLRATAGFTFAAPDPRMVILLLPAFGRLKAVSIGGADPTGAPNCPSTLSGSGICRDASGPAVVYIQEAENTGTGACPGISTPPFPNMNAQYQQIFNAYQQAMWSQVFGQTSTQPPLPGPFTMQ